MKYWILTNSGIQFDLENPTPDMVCIEDIAHALSQMCRFNGHTDRFYSVAEHSLNVCGVVEGKFKLDALLHDATEAYIPDVTRPLKHMLPIFSDVESKIAAVISEKFGILFPTPKEVKEADARMLKTEKLALFKKEASRHAWDASIESLKPYDISIYHYISESPAAIRRYFDTQFQKLR